VTIDFALIDGAHTFDYVLVIFSARCARSARRTERSVAPPDPPTPAHAIRQTLGKARSRPARPGAGGSRTRGRRGGGREEKPRSEAGDRAARSGRPRRFSNGTAAATDRPRLIRPASLERLLMLVGMEPPLAIYRACLALEGGPPASHRCPSFFDRCLSFTVRETKPKPHDTGSRLTPDRLESEPSQVSAFPRSRSLIGKLPTSR
jgi:hypothetical protein